MIDIEPLDAAAPPVPPLALLPLVPIAIVMIATIGWSIVETIRALL